MFDQNDNDEMDKKDWDEYLNKDFYWNFSYQHLFDKSEFLDQTKYENFKQWNVFSVKGFENYKQIFYDIANSKKARSLYRKINFYAILSNTVMSLPIIFFVFVFADD